MKNKYELRHNGKVLKAGTRQECVSELNDIADDTRVTRYFMLEKAGYSLVDLKQEREELGLVPLYNWMYFCMFIPLLGAIVFGVCEPTLRYDNSEKLIRAVFVYQILCALMLHFLIHG